MSKKRKWMRRKRRGRIGMKRRKRRRKMEMKKEKRRRQTRSAAVKQGMW